MRITYLLFLSFLPQILFADAGPKIGRPKAPCSAVIKGIEKMTDVYLYKVTDRNGRLDDKKLGDSTNLVQNNDSISLNYDDARWWKGPLKIVAISKTTGQRLDSVTWSANEKNLVITFTGMENGKMKYTIQESKAYYPYHLFSEDEGNSAAVANRNKMILIALSVIGFLTLGFLFYQRRRSSGVKEGSSSK